MTGSKTSLPAPYRPSAEVKTESVYFGVPRGFAGFLFDITFFLPTFLPTRTYIAASIFNLSCNVSAFLPYFLRSLPIIPTIIPPFHASRFGVSRRRPNQRSDCSKTKAKLPT